MRCYFFNLPSLFLAWSWLWQVVTSSNLPSDFPTKLGEYELLGLVSRSGSGGLLIQATHPELSQVLLKFTQTTMEEFDQVKKITQLVQAKLANSVKLLGELEWKGYRVLVLERLPAEPISQAYLFNDDEPFNQEEALIVKKLANEVWRLKQANIAHRDIKPSNILLHQGSPILIDFDLAVDLSNVDKVRLEGTEEYMPPELELLMYTGQDEFDGLNGLALTEVLHKGDVFALGLVFAQMLTRTQYTPRVKDDPFYSLLVDLDNEIFASLPSPPMQVLKGMLDPNPQTRWSIEQVINSDWLLSIRSEVVRV